jgi:hypothetical protein
VRNQERVNTPCMQQYRRCNIALEASMLHDMCVAIALHTQELQRLHLMRDRCLCHTACIEQWAAIQATVTRLHWE